jgi:hypothetical protein
MTKKFRMSYLKAIYQRYHKASKALKTRSWMNSAKSAATTANTPSANCDHGQSQTFPKQSVPDLTPRLMTPRYCAL